MTVPGSDDFGCSSFAQRGGLGNLSATALSLSNGATAEAHQLFGAQLPKLLNELNEVLAAYSLD